MPRYTKAEQEEAKATLREFLPQGATVNLVLQKVARSGMSRVIKCLAVNENNQPFDVSWYVGRALEMTVTDDYLSGVRIGGCGMDMGLALVDNLSYALYGKPINQRQANTRHNDADSAEYDLAHGLRYKWL